MSLMSFPKKNVDGGGWVGGWVELYPIVFWIFGIFLTLQSPLVKPNSLEFGLMKNSIILDKNMLIVSRAFYLE